MSDCPSHQQLSRFLEGEIFDEAQRQEIDDHVQDCADCVETLADLSASEVTFVERLRADPVAPFAEEACCADVVQRVIEVSDHPEFSDGGRDAAESNVKADNSGTPRDNAPEQIGPYEIIERLGRGGMGTVYLARHVHLNRAVALKVLRKVRDADSIARFVQEMHAIGAIDHPNIVSANDSGIADGQHFLVMQLIPGIDASKLVRHFGPLPVADACEVVRQAALGLQHIHDLGMVHRDIKPANLMLQSVRPAAEERSSARTSNGGSWHGDAYHCRPACRHGVWSDPNTNTDMGLRLILEVQSEKLSGPPP